MRTLRLRSARGPWHSLTRFLLPRLLGGFVCAWLAGNAAATPVSSTPVRTFVGYVDYVGTGATIRTNSDAVNPCSVTPSNTTTSATLTGIPTGATVVAAYLYWAGSGATADYDVTFNGSNVSADTEYSEQALGTYDFFSGVEDVTALVSGNGTYTFSGMDVDNDAPFCAVSGVLAGWALIVIYSEPSEPFRTINLFEGFQAYRGSSVTLSPSNFVIPGSAIDGRLGVLSWEGDAGNSGTLGGVSENLFFNGQNTPQVALTDGLNPTNNQYNSTINSSGSTNVYGVDLDIYDISAHLTVGDSSASTTYQSGQDLVLLSAEIISVTNTPATDLGLAKTASGTFVRGATGQFDFSVSNLGPLTHNDVVTITDTLPAGLGYSGFTSADPLWSCTNPSGATVSCVHSGANLLVGNALPTVSVTVDVAANATGTLTNSATLASNVFDPLPGNNTDSADGVVPVADLTNSQKTVSDVNSGLVQAGDTLEFTIEVSDANNSQTIVNVTDTLSALLTNLTVLDLAGGTDFSTSTTLDVRAITVPAGASASVRFSADVVGSAITGDIVTNTATIENVLEGGTLDVSSVDLTVGDTSGSASGTKPLYLNNIPSGGSPLTMSRVPLTAISAPVVRQTIRRQDDAVTWDMAPATASTLSLGTTAIPVRLLMRRNTSTAVRNVRVSISYSGAASGFIGCADLSIPTSGAGSISATVTQEFTFNVSRTDTSCTATTALGLDLPAGTTIALNVDNEVGGGTDNDIFVYPFDSSLGTSNLELPATTVINVDSLEFFNDAYPAGTAVTAVESGEAVYVRSVVSDPFGAFDITAATLTIMDSAGATTVTQALDPGNQVATDAATKTYEYLYTVPGAGPLGTWVASLVAEEGSEGTISHARLANLQVITRPVISLAKSSETLSDPMGSSNPKSIPGAIIRFSIEVHNQGPGDADNIVVVDNLPPQARLLFDTATLDPIVFVDGATPSGLTYTFGGLADAGDDIQFSNNGGTSVVTPSVDPGSGLDTTTPRINHLQISPQGLLAPAATGPSFTLQLLMQVD